MAVNLISGPRFTSAGLVTDTVAVPGGSSDTIPGFTEIGGNPISTCWEFRSEYPVKIPTTTVAAIELIPNLADGSIMYVSDGATPGMYLRTDGAWVSLGANDISGPSTTTLNAAAIWGNTSGNQLLDSNVIVDTSVGTVTLTATVGTPQLRINNSTNTFYTGLSSASPASDYTANAEFSLPADNAGNIIPTFGPSGTSSGAIMPLMVDTNGKMHNSYTPGTSGVMFASFTLTNAQINAMYANPHRLLDSISAYGTQPLDAQNTYVIHSCIFNGYGPTGHVDGGNIFLTNSNTPGGGGFYMTDPVDPVVVRENTADNVAMAQGTYDSPITGVISPPPFSSGVYITNDTGAFTGGDKDLDVHIFYSIINTT